MNTPDTAGSILVKGRNYWKKGRARRAAFLVDASNYFSAFVDAAMKAERTIYITGWDIDSRTRLIRDSETRDFPVCLGEFLNHVAEKRPDLHIYILLWDYAILYALDREPFPIWIYSWKTNRRVHFFLDNFLPLGASHHQKVVVIDDRIAFAGGLDITSRRWDANEHYAEDSRRTDPWGKEYPPFHDVQFLVDGEVAGILGELFRNRWLHATGKKLPAPEAYGSDPWPERFRPDLTDIDIAVSRTEPAYRTKSEVREVEALWLDAISSARKTIYIENPFFTSSKIAGAIAKRLQEKDGPEIVIIARKKSHGWLEEYTMDAIRAHLVERVRRLDHYGRFGFYYPEIPGRDDILIEVHAKVLIIDDTFVRVGSSNLSNRSMGLDTECDLSFETGDSPGVRATATALRYRLLAEHLDSTPQKVAEVLQEQGSLIKTIDALCGKSRVLCPLNATPMEKNILSEPYLVDPERPISAERFVKKFVGEENQVSGRKKIIASAVLVLFLIVLAAMWRWSPLASYLNATLIAEKLEALRNYPMAPLVVLALYMAGGLIIFPVLLLIVITSILFTPLIAFVIAMTGCLLSALMMFWIGDALGRNFVRAVAGKRINRLSRSLSRQGLLTIAILRIVPVAPYSIINLVAGASHIKLSDFLIGTVIGMLPGIATITIFTESLKHFILEPSFTNIALLVGTMLLAVFILVWLSRFTGRLSRKLRGDSTP